MFSKPIHEGIVALPTREGAEIKIRQIRKAGKTPIICAILPDDLRRAFLAFLGRERKFSARYFYRTHAGSRKTLLWIARHFPDVELRIFESAESHKHILDFTFYTFSDRLQMLEFLRSIQLTQKQVIATIKRL